MSNEKPPTGAPAPAWMIGPGGAKPIAIQKLAMRVGITVDLPGGKGAARYVMDDSLVKDATGKRQPERVNIPRFKIWYLPWLGMYAVTFYPPIGDRKVDEPVGAPIWIPREWVSAEPAE